MLDHYRTSFITPQKFEEIMSGCNYVSGMRLDFSDSQVDIEHLKSITQYISNDMDEHHEDVQRFWRVLATFSQEQLSGYVQYVSGKSRLNSGSSDIHKISYISDKNGIPEAHTCYFELDLGSYDTDEELRWKLLYGIENCKEIAEENSNYHLGASFGLEF